MNAITNRCFWVLTLVGLSLPQVCVANAIGSGTISARFSDEILLASAPQILPVSASLPVVSHGSGSSQYQWGLSSADSRFFLDGVETALADINALNLSAEETLARVTHERLSVPAPATLGFLLLAYGLFGAGYRGNVRFLHAHILLFFAVRSESSICVTS